MTLAELRHKHPRLVYESFETDVSRGKLTITFTLRLEPGIVFRPQVTIPVEKVVSKPIVDSFAFHLGLMECISYWKSACSGELIVKSGFLNPEQIAWWHDLFLNGLGEFFFTNKIDFTKKDFLKIMSGAEGTSPLVAGKNSGPASEDSFRNALDTRPLKSESGPNFVGSQARTSQLSGDLVLVGGGKDSAVALEVLEKVGRPTRAMVLNPTQAALANIKIAGLKDPIIVSRTIDSNLLKLNSSGYLNGHTPFSAYLAFLGLFVATIHGFEHAIVANEASASEGNIMYKGIEINHQYSKSFRFEKLFREYARKYLPAKSDYFSLLRPLGELQIAKIFSRYPQYFNSFRSCNVGSKTNSWCGSCPKCAFAWLILSPFLSKARLIAIFGKDILQNPTIKRYLRELVGLGKQKPFECVGTREECRVAMHFGDQKYAKLRDSALKSWNTHHFVPKRYQDVLRSML